MDKTITKFIKEPNKSNALSFSYSQAVGPEARSFALTVLLNGEVVASVSADDGMTAEQRTAIEKLIDVFMPRALLKDGFVDEATAIAMEADAVKLEPKLP
jgi:hypothetical protein